MSVWIKPMWYYWIENNFISYCSTQHIANRCPHQELVHIVMYQQDFRSTLHVIMVNILTITRWCWAGLVFRMCTIATGWLVEIDKNQSGGWMLVSSFPYISGSFCPDSSLKLNPTFSKSIQTKSGPANVCRVLKDWLIQLRSEQRQNTWGCHHAKVLTIKMKSFEAITAHQEGNMKVSEPNFTALSPIDVVAKTQNGDQIWMLVQNPWRYCENVDLLVAF